MKKVQKLRRLLKMLSTVNLHNFSDRSQLEAFYHAYAFRGFNGQIMRAAFLVWLFESAGCTSFVETGTSYGLTTLAASRMFRRPVFTVELVGSRLLKAKILSLLCIAAGKGGKITFNKGSSPEWLKKILTGSRVGSLPMVYLDAHWYDYLPLRDELKICLARGDNIVVIDDFEITSDPGFGYDQYKDKKIGIDLIADLLPKDRVEVLLPAYESEHETHDRRGTCVILIDVQLNQIKKKSKASHKFASTLFEKSNAF